MYNAAYRRLLSAFTNGDFRRLRRRDVPHATYSGVTSPGKRASNYASIATEVSNSSLPTSSTRRRVALVKRSTRRQPTTTIFDAFLNRSGTAEKKMFTGHHINDAIKAGCSSVPQSSFSTDFRIRFATHRGGGGSAATAGFRGPCTVYTRIFCCGCADRNIENQSTLPRTRSILLFTCHVTSSRLRTLL